MRFFQLLFVSIFLLFENLNGQDGSDIMYFNISAIDTSFIGKEVHFDFYYPSFGGVKRDSVTININNKPVIFLENRKDDHFNNWFSQQYLEEIKINGKEKLRLSKSVIRKVTNDSILVTGYFDLFNGKNIVQKKSFTQDIWFDKKIITQILVHSEQCCK